MIWNRKGCSKTGKWCSKTGKWCSKTENLVFFLKILKFILSRDRGVCPGTFAPALVLGQRDSRTGKFFVPGQRDNGKSLGNLLITEVMLTWGPYCSRRQHHGGGVTWDLSHVTMPEGLYMPFLLCIYFTAIPAHNLCINFQFLVCA